MGEEQKFVVTLHLKANFEVLLFSLWGIIQPSSTTVCQPRSSRGPLPNGAILAKAASYSRASRLHGLSELQLSKAVDHDVV